MTATRKDTRQIVHRTYLVQLASVSEFGSAIAGGKPANSTELDNLVGSIENELTPSFVLRPNTPNDLQVTVGSATLTNPETGKKRTNLISPDFSGGDITFPASSGGNIVVNPGTNKVLTLTNNNYIKALVEITDAAEINIELGTEGISEATATLPDPTSGNLAVGYIVLYNNAGTIDNLGFDSIYQFSAGSGASSGSGTIQSAFCYTDDSEVAENCIVSVFGGKTRITLAFSYDGGINAGGSEGALDIHVDGQKVPRDVPTTTVDAYYTEVNSTTIDLDQDYSGQKLSVHIVRRSASVDASASNTTRITDAESEIEKLKIHTGVIVSSLPDADFDTLQAAINAASAGDKITLGKGTFTENISINKQVFIEGVGNSTIINGTVNFTTGSTGSLTQYLKFADNVTVDNGIVNLIITNCWLAATKTVTDNNPTTDDSLYLLVEEV